jgi:hypothetical protein
VAEKFLKLPYVRIGFGHEEPVLKLLGSGLDAPTLPCLHFGRTLGVGARNLALLAQDVPTWPR